MIPFILILFAIVLWGIGLRSNSNPTYSFTKTDKYKFELETSYHNIKYFVDQNTFDLIRGSQSTTIRIENIVDNDYYQKMRRIWRNSNVSIDQYKRQAKIFYETDSRHEYYKNLANSVDISSWNIADKMDEKE